MTLTMTRTRTTLAAAVAGAALAGFAFPAVVQASTAATVTGLTNAQLTEMREEERVARDLYTQLATTSGSAIFTRIAAAEQRHMDAVERLMTSQGMDPDAAGDTVGRYAVRELQVDYDRWMARGKVSDEAAYKVGVELEKQDIAGLKSLNVKDGTSGDRVVDALIRGSEHHLAAFTKAVNGDLTGIGPGTGMGRGMGGGMGPGAGPGMGARQGRGGTDEPGSACPFGDDGQGPGGPAGRGTGQGRGAGWSS